jgi:hypothetical protein
MPYILAICLPGLERIEGMSNTIEIPLAVAIGRINGPRLSVDQTAATGKFCRKTYGAGYKIRTRDPLITNQVLYQLS